MEKEAVMAHLTLQLGAAIIVPFDLKRGRRAWRNYWRTRALREAAATEAGLPALSTWVGSHAQMRQTLTVGGARGAGLDGAEA
jgi:hypothetical protein